MNLPNKITISRIFLIPIFMIFMMPLPDWILDLYFFKFVSVQLKEVNEFIKVYGNVFATVVFIIAAITDGVDGYIARKKKMVTRFGKFLDPIADKLLITAALIALVQKHEVTGWVATVIIGREFIVTGLRLVAAADGIVITASKLGKIKTVIQIVAIILSLINNYTIKLITDFPFDKLAMSIAVFITIYSGYDYIIKNYKVIEYK